MIAEQVSVEKVLQLLSRRGEHDNWDFKESIDLDSTRGKLELARDLLALANTTGGGHLIFGVSDKDFEIVGLTKCNSMDTTKIYNATNKFITADLKFVCVEYEVAVEDVMRRVGVIYVPEYNGIAVPAQDGDYRDEKNRPRQAFKKGDVIVRRGAQTCPANQADFDRLVRGTRRQQDIPEDEVRPPLIGHMPSRAEIALEFVGRRDELRDLWVWFLDPYNRRWLLVGDGGKGKTAIAYELATKVQSISPQGYEAVIWVSAKKRRFLEGIIKSMESPDFCDLDSLLNALARAFGIPSDRMIGARQKREAVKEYLNMLPALIVADDIDSLEADAEDAVEFLTFEAANTHSKVLLTSRRMPFGWGTTSTQVRGLDYNDAREFIVSRIRLLDLDASRFSDQLSRKIWETTEGSPLYIEDLLRLCRVLPVNEALEGWKTNRGEAAREYSLKREFDFLSDNAKTLVLACCMNEGPISLSELQITLGLTTDAIEAEMGMIQKFILGEPAEVDRRRRTI